MLRISWNTRAALTRKTLLPFDDRRKYF